MEKPRKGLTGVYEICNLQTGERFIGASASIAKSIQNHLKQLWKEAHNNTPLLISWREHGPTAFSFSLLEITEDKYELYDREKYWSQKRNAVPIDDSALKGYYAQLKAKTLISVGKDAKEELKDLDLGSMDSALRELIDFYKKKTQNES